MKTRMPALECNCHENNIPQTDYTAMTNGVQLVMPLNCETGCGILPSAVLRYQSENGFVRYYDTARTLAIKRQLAEVHGCRAVFGLMCEHEVLEEQ